MLLGKCSLLSFWRSQSVFIFSCHRKQMGKFSKNLSLVFLFPPLLFYITFLFVKPCVWFFNWTSKVAIHAFPITNNPVCNYFCEIGGGFENVQEFPFFSPSMISLRYLETILIKACQNWTHIPITWGSCYKVYSDPAGPWRVLGLKVTVSNQLPDDLHVLFFKINWCVYFQLQ